MLSDEEDEDNDENDFFLFFFLFCVVAITKLALGSILCAHKRFVTKGIPFYINISHKLSALCRILNVCLNMLIVDTLKSP